MRLKTGVRVQLIDPDYPEFHGIGTITEDETNGLGNLEITLDNGEIMNYPLFHDEDGNYPETLSEDFTNFLIILE